MARTRDAFVFGWCGKPGIDILLLGHRHRRHDPAGSPMRHCNSGLSPSHIPHRNSVLLVLLAHRTRMGFSCPIGPEWVSSSVSGTLQTRWTGRDLGSPPTHTRSESASCHVQPHYCISHGHVTQVCEGVTSRVPYGISLHKGRFQAVRRLRKQFCLGKE